VPLAQQIVGGALGGLGLFGSLGNPALGLFGNLANSGNSSGGGSGSNSSS